MFSIQSVLLNPGIYESIFTNRPKISPNEFLALQAAQLLQHGLVKRATTDLLIWKAPWDRYSLLMPRRIHPGQFKELMKLIPYYDANLWKDVELWEKRPGLSSIDETSAHGDLVHQPDCAYLCVGIEDGRARLNKTAAQNSREIAAEHRKPYTTANALFHAITFSMFLETHGMQILGSRCGLTGVPGLRVLGGLPILDLPNRDPGSDNPNGCSDGDLPYADHGAPSYTHIVEL